MNDTIKNKLNPHNFDHMSGKMSAIVGYVLQERYTTPKIIKMEVADGGYVMATLEDNWGDNHFMGTLSEVRGNWRKLMESAGLTDDEMFMADKAYHSKLPIAGRRAYVPVPAIEASRLTSLSMTF